MDDGGGSKVTVARRNLWEDTLRMLDVHDAPPVVSHDFAIPGPAFDRMLAHQEAAFVGSDHPGRNLPRNAETFEDKVMRTIRDFCMKRRTEVERCVVTVRDGDLSGTLVQRQDRYNEALDDAITNVELDLVDRGWMISLQQVPGFMRDEVRAFVNFVANDRE